MKKLNGDIMTLIVHYDGVTEEEIKEIFKQNSDEADEDE